ncbi:hypothetical protein [Hoeflea marina]|uniref:hypothetical protein n=1 Tax=Hoeflea marina TaxID=274592 RepID=UPI000D710B07|nr:hypothetical protein [Hoeflea marina]
MAADYPPLFGRYLATIDPDVGVVVEVVRREEASTPVAHRKVAFCVSGAIGYRVVADEHALSSISIDLERRLVTKHVAAYSEFGILEREVDWLRRLAASGIAPPLRSATADRLFLDYVGEPVRRGNLPSDWPVQAEAILAALTSHGCAHNDIKCDNLTVADGKIHLIDYGWATPIGQAIPAHWPHGIGRQHRLGVHRFDDRAAIFAALGSAERGEVDRSVVMGHNPT